MTYDISRKFFFIAPYIRVHFDPYKYMHVCVMILPWETSFFFYTRKSENTEEGFTRETTPSLHPPPTRGGAGSHSSIDSLDTGEEIHEFRQSPGNLQLIFLSVLFSGFMPRPSVQRRQTMCIYVFTDVLGL